MKCWCGKPLSGSLCVGCNTHFVDCRCAEPQEHGPKELTDHQRTILMLYASTGSSKETGHLLGISPRSVRNQLVTIRHKLGVDTTIQALVALLGRDEEAA